MKESVAKLLDRPLRARPGSPSPREAAQLAARFSRRALMKGTAAAAAGASWVGDSDFDGVLAQVNTASKPAQLKITDLRITTVVGAPMTCPIIRIDTNQGLVGYGEVRDGANPVYALFLKSRLLGENPCNVDRLFRKIKQFGGQSRQAGGVCGVEMALWDLAGKAYNVPAYQMLGGKFREKVRCYADTVEQPTGRASGKKLKDRITKYGFTFLKIDFGTPLLRDIPGTLTKPLGSTYSNGDMVPHPFANLGLTDKGVAWLANYAGEIRQEIGPEVPLAADHFGHLDVNSCIKLAQALEKHNMAWLEDMVPWQFGGLMKQIKESTTSPILTGEDIYLKEDFIKLMDMGAVDMVHPDLASSGGLLETKKIGDAAMERGIPMAMHFAGTPISFMANVHCAAATENFVALEHHSVDIPWWESLVTSSGPLFKDGFANVYDAPGLGVNLNEDVVRQHMRGEYFKPTPEWSEMRSVDRLWSLRGGEGVAPSASDGSGG
jgi:L-alanine-DL-glutamate epimerase-like enolase superfamily enzyme